MNSELNYGNASVTSTALGKHVKNDTSSDTVLLLLDDDNYWPTYNHHKTSLIVICMVCAWVMLIVSVTICCFSQCHVVKRAKNILHGSWQANDRARDRNNSEPVDICRHFPPDYEVESLPSYTIVSGLPTYDAALEEFRKAGIILSPSSIPMVKIFEKEALAVSNTTKENHIFNIENELSNDSDNISVTSICTCGAANNTNSSNNSNGLLSTTSALNSQIIELSPEQLAALSQKRLSLQISFNNNLQRRSRHDVDLYRQVNRNNMLRSHAAAAAASASSGAAQDGFPQIHRSSSSLTLCNEPHIQHLQHRGSLF
ncbi:uncharacterized protein comm3 isoform X3 [Eurosta solidaginis]